MRSIFYASDADSDRYADALIGYARSGLPRSATPLSEVVIARSPRKHCAAVDEVGVLTGQLLQSADSLGSVVVRDPCGLLLQSTHVAWSSLYTATRDPCGLLLQSTHVAWSSLYTAIRDSCGLLLQSDQRPMQPSATEYTRSVVISIHGYQRPVRPIATERSVVCR